VLEGVAPAVGTRVRIREQSLPEAGGGADSSRELPVRFD